jgi:hypothetical protein
MPTMENAPAPAPEEQPAVSEAPVTEQPAPSEAPTTIEAGGKQFSSPAELAEAYTNAQSSMTQAQQEAAELRQVKEQWDQFGNALDNDPGLREHIEGYYAESPNAAAQRPTALDPNAQEINQLKQQVETERLNREITDLGTKGFNVTPARKDEILRHIALNPHIRNADKAYKDLYYEADMKAAKEKATADTAGQMADNQGAYTQPPAGTQAPDKSFGDLTSEEQESELLRDIGNVDLSGLGA